MVLRFLPAATLCLIPLGQAPVLLMKQEAPGELDHAATDPSIARLGEPLLSSARTTFVG